RRNPLSISFGSSTRGPFKSCRCRHLCRVNGSTLPCFDDLPRIASKQDQGTVPSFRSIRDLCCHCRDIHSLHFWSVARRLGLDALHPGLDSCHFRDSIHAFRRVAESLARHLVLSWTWLDRTVRLSPVLAAYTGGRIALDRRRRTRLYGGSY